jgi:autotransporter-associated beta strand protein
MKTTQSWLPGRHAILPVVMACGLSACGGGGGNVRPPAPAPAPAPAPPPPAAPQPPLDAQLALTHAYDAHNQGYTGAGVVIGIVDTGVMRNHPALAGRVLDELIFVDSTTNNTAIDDVVGHGTWVSEIAAGTSFDQFPGGIAPGANLVSARIISDTTPKDDGSGQGNVVTAADADFFAQTLNPALISAGVQVMNNSWGGIYWDTTNASINQAFGKAYEPFVLQHGGLVVFAAGNDARSDPSDIAALPSLAPQLEPGWLVAVAVDSNHPTQLASYSNACGKAMNYCLAAPGDVIVSGKDDTATHTSYYVVEGTSFAAPQVSGGAALVWQAYPYFNNDLVRQTLLGTADDLGAPGPDPVFGYGELDVGKAVNGPARFDWGDVNVSFDGISSSWNNPISGAGGLIKSGTGTLVLTQPSSYTGQTEVVGGTLKATALTSNVLIDAAGELRTTPSVVGAVSNSGVLTVANGDTTITGNYSQADSGRLAVTLGSALRVSGSASLPSVSTSGTGDLYVIGINQGYVANSHTEVLTAAGGLTGTFAALNTAPSVLLTASLDYDASSAWLNVQQVSATTVQGLSYTPASFAAAQRVDGGFALISGSTGSATLPVTGSFVQGAASLQHTGSVAALSSSLESLSGQLHAASAAMTFEAIDAGTRALSDRFDSLLDTPQAGGWTQNLGYHGGLSRSGYGNVGVDLGGIMLGADQRIGRSGFAGYALSRSDGLGRLAESADQGRSHALEAMMYGGAIQGSWYTMGRLGLGSYRETMRRQLELGIQFAGVSSDSSGRYGVAYAESGYRLTLGHARVTPYVDLQYAQINRDGFNEQGGYGFGLKANGQTVARWQAGAGVRAMREWRFAGGGSLSLQAHALWQQTLASRGDIFQASFSGINQFAPVAGIGLSRYGGVAGLSLQWGLTSHASLQLGYDNYIGQHERASMGTLGYRLTF